MLSSHRYIRAAFSSFAGSPVYLFCIGEVEERGLESRIQVARVTHQITCKMNMTNSSSSSSSRYVLKKNMRLYYYIVDVCNDDDCV